MAIQPPQAWSCFGEQFDRREDRVDRVVERVHALRELRRAGRELPVGARQAFGARRRLRRSRPRAGPIRPPPGRGPLCSCFAPLPALARFAGQSLRACCARGPFRLASRFAPACARPVSAREPLRRPRARDPFRLPAAAPRSGRCSGAAAERSRAARGRGETLPRSCATPSLARLSPERRPWMPSLGAFQALGRGGERGVGLRELARAPLRPTPGRAPPRRRARGRPLPATSSAPAGAVGVVIAPSRALATITNGADHPGPIVRSTISTAWRAGLEAGSSAASGGPMRSAPAGAASASIPARISGTVIAGWAISRSASAPARPRRRSRAGAGEPDLPAVERRAEQAQQRRHRASAPARRSEGPR